MKPMCSIRKCVVASLPPHTHSKAHGLCVVYIQSWRKSPNIMIMTRAACHTHTDCLANGNVPVFSYNTIVAMLMMPMKRGTTSWASSHNTYARRHT